MSRPATTGVVVILLLSGLMTALSSAVVSPRSAPDERHHYAYVKHVANQPLQFPPRLEQIRTDLGDPNHLIHPPLYYQLMAIPYALLDVERQLTELGRELDRYGMVSSTVAIPALRSASLLFAALHLVGLYLLIRDLVITGTMPAWGGVLAAACSALVPGFIFIAGTLNNDVLAMAVWPFLVLATIRFLREGNYVDVCLATALTAIAILTKATLWLLALCCAAAVVVRLVMFAGQARERRLSEIARSVWTRFAPTTLREWMLFASVFVAVLAALVVLADRLIRYDSLQPPYHVVFGIPIEESKFHRMPEGGFEERSPLEFVDLYFPLAMRSLFGVVGHDERLFSPHPERLGEALMALSVLAVLVTLWRLVRLPRDAAGWLAAGMLGVSLLYVILLLTMAFESYERYGHFGVHGRYFIGYLDLWILGLVIVLGRARETAGSWWGRTATRLLSSVVAAVLALLFVHPFYYLSRTTEFHARAGIPRRIKTEASDRGLTLVALEPVAPTQFVRGGRRHAKDLLPNPRFVMAWRGSRLVGTVDTGGGSCVEVWLYGIGERAWGENSKLAVRLAPGVDEESPPCADAVLELPPRPEVVRSVLAAPQLERSVLIVEARNVRAPARWHLLDKWWLRSRVPHLFAVYAGPAVCR